MVRSDGFRRPARLRGPWLAARAVLAATALVAVILPLSGCERVRKGEQTTVQAGDRGEEVLYTSAEGGFQVAFPAGCDSLVVQTRPLAADGDSEALARMMVYCDRAHRPEEGCSVEVLFNLRDPEGGPPTPELVIEAVKRVMRSFRVEITTQQPIRRGPLEGVQVHCTEPGLPGEVWVEGLLAGERVIVLTAWKARGDLFGAEEIRRFFASLSLIEE